MTRAFRLFRFGRGMALALVVLERCRRCRRRNRPRRRIAVAANRYGRRSSRRCSTPIRVVQAQNALQLTDAQYGPFVTRLRKLQENRRRNNQIRNRLLQELRTMAAPNATRTRTRCGKSCGPCASTTSRARRRSQRDSEAVDEVLDVRQQVRFRLLEERLERQKLDLLMRSRRGAAPPAGGRGPQLPGLQ